MSRRLPPQIQNKRRQYPLPPSDHSVTQIGPITTASSAKGKGRAPPFPVGPLSPPDTSPSLRDTPSETMSRHQGSSVGRRVRNDDEEGHDFLSRPAPGRSSDHPSHHAPPQPHARNEESRTDVRSGWFAEGRDQLGTSASRDSPVIFQCAECRHILSDSIALLGIRKDLKLAVFSSVTAAVAISSTLSTIQEHGPDLGATYIPLMCEPCESVVGRVYRTTSADLDLLRDAYSFDMRYVSTYELGTTSRSEDLPPLSDRSPPMDTDSNDPRGAYNDDSSVPPGPHPRPQQRRPSSPPAHMMGPMTPRHHPPAPSSFYRTPSVAPPMSARGSATPGPGSGGELHKMRMMLMAIGERIVSIEKRMDGGPPSLSDTPSERGGNLFRSRPGNGNGNTNPLMTPQRIPSSNSGSGLRGMPPHQHQQHQAGPQSTGRPIAASPALSTKGTPLRQQLIGGPAVSARFQQTQRTPQQQQHPQQQQQQQPQQQSSTAKTLPSQPSTSSPRGRGQQAIGPPATPTASRGPPPRNLGNAVLASAAISANPPGPLPTSSSNRSLAPPPPAKAPAVPIDDDDNDPLDGLAAPDEHVQDNSFDGLDGDPVPEQDDAEAGADATGGGALDEEEEMPSGPGRTQGPKRGRKRKAI